MLKSADAAAAATRFARIAKALNRHYYGAESELANVWAIGSWGKKTQIAPPRDVDMLFALPTAVYHRFQARTGNKQSALLQEVKDVVLSTYASTDVGGDGQVVAVTFALSFDVEVAPAFHRLGGGFLTCDSNDGGQYRRTFPLDEFAYLEQVDDETGGALRRLIRYLKRWQTHCNVPMKSFWLEILATVFIRDWAYRHRKSFWFDDWMVRDFFAYLSRPGPWRVRLPYGEWQPIGSAFTPKAERAYRKAVAACVAESNQDGVLAGLYWQDIFGTDISLG